MKIDNSNEEELIIKAQKGDSKARTALMELYLPYIEGIACKKYCNPDLTSEALLEFNDCIDRYKVGSNAKLGTYAYKYILHHLNEYVNNLKYSNGMIQKIRRLKREYAAIYGFDPEPEDIAEEYGIDVGKVRTAYDILLKREVRLTNDIDIMDEEYIDSPLLTIPNGLLTTEEKQYLELYLRYGTDKDIMKKMSITLNDCRLYYKSIIDKLKEYYQK